MRYKKAVGEEVLMDSKNSLTEAAASTSGPLLPDSNAFALLRNGRSCPVVLPEKRSFCGRER
jgi:hypothetical protein